MTTLVGPYDALNSSDKTRVQCGVSQDVYDSLFHKRFTMRGAQDRIVASLLDWFHNEMNHHAVPEHYDPDNELLAQRVLDQLHTIHTNPHIPYQHV